MQEVDILNRIVLLCEARSWTTYRLAKESGITYSTLCTMLHKANAPSIPTLMKICNGLGISMSEFFREENDTALLAPQDRQYLEQWTRLSPENQSAAGKYIQYLLTSQEPAPAVEATE